MSAVRISKFLSLVLRHDPARIGITLDEAGWTDVDALLAAAAAHGVTIWRDQLREIVASSDKQRFALSEDGTRIRANQGHSVSVDLQLPPREPPAMLYHGTVAAALPGIRAQGLLRGKRHDVHLSADLETAKKVGSRRGAPLILEIRAADMHAAGHVFTCSENGVWLTDRVPPEFIVEPQPPAAAGGNERPGRRLDVRARGGIAQTTLAAIQEGRYTNGRHEIVEIGADVDAAVQGTVLHDLASFAPAPAAGSRGTPTRMTVTTETTIQALARLALEPGGHLACLNFASAKNPGGGFLGGAQAQEEAIARSSALYPCLLAQRAHYDRNRAHDSAIYLDLAIFSPRVPVFRTDRGAWFDQPILASVITCAAPNASALRQQRRFDAAAVEAALRRRAEFVLAIAAHHSVERFVLGAWGAGVFGNDPAMVARALGDPLRGEFAGVFTEIVFAVPQGPNHAAFAAAFNSP